MSEIPMNTIQSRRLVYSDEKVLRIELKEVDGGARFITLTTATVVEGVDRPEKQFTLPAEVADVVAEAIEAFANWPATG